MRTASVRPMTTMRSISRNAKDGACTRVASPGHDADAIEFGLPLQARCKVYGIAKRRIAEALVRTHIAHHAAAAVDADPHLEGLCVLPVIRRTLAVQIVQSGLHGQCRFAGVSGMFGIVQRSVPERHDAIADIFVNGAPVRQDRRRHRSEGTD